VDDRQYTHPDDAIETHYSCLERSHVCLDGFVYVGYVVESKHDLEPETVEYRKIPCRRCNGGEEA
jgi:hypothetical protein